MLFALKCMCQYHIYGLVHLYLVNSSTSTISTLTIEDEIYNIEEYIHNYGRFFNDMQSCLRAWYPSKRDSEMLKSRFKKCAAFVPSLFPKRVIKKRA